MHTLRPLFGLGLLLIALHAAAPAADWEMRVDDDGGIAITNLQAPVVSTQYVFWGPNWLYSGVRKDSDTRNAAGARVIQSRVFGQRLRMQTTIQSTEPGTLRYEWLLESEDGLESLTGGGLEFTLDLDCPSFGAKPPDPELLADNRGWTWQVEPEGALTVQFDPPAQRVYFEQGRRNQIRAFLIGESFAAGTKQLAMTVTLPPGGQIVQSLEERYGSEDTADWYRGALLYNASPVDLSFLNHKPAGAHGSVRPDFDRLVFEDGTEARFWGGNIAAYAIYEPEDKIREQAKRIAALGYNLMRIHHHDSMRWVDRTVIDSDRPDSQHLDPEVMQRLDFWIKCLKDEGVYVWLDLHVGRLFKEGDEIPGWADLAKGTESPSQGAEAKGFCYFNSRIEELMQDFNRKYLNHVNEYTGLAYKDDPAIMGLLITNENDLTSHFGNAMLADKGVLYHNNLFNQAASEFAGQHNLPLAEVTQTWIPGPSKLFLAQVEHAWNVRMLEHLASLGVRVPVATTQMWGNMDMFGLPALTAGSIIDVHSYGSAEALSTNPRYDHNYVTYMATGQAYGMPVAITEWNVPWPQRDRFTSPLYVASIAALQGWDAPMIYNYTQTGLADPSRQDRWSTFTDPALTGMTPAAALLFRQAHVRPAVTTYCLAFDRDALYLQSHHPRNMASLRTLVEQSKLVIGMPDTQELDWDADTSERIEAHGRTDEIIVLSDLDRDFIPEGRTSVVADTGELERDWKRGVQYIRSPRTQAAHGWIGGEAIDLGNVRLEIENPKAAIAVQSLDGRPISESASLLLTALARVVAPPGGGFPLLSEPVRGKIRLQGREGLKLIPLAPNGDRLEPLHPEARDGWITLGLPSPRGTHWFLLEAPS